MSTYQALLYPFLHFKDDGRIVPNDDTTDDSETVKALGLFRLNPAARDERFDPS